MQGYTLYTEPPQSPGGKSVFYYKIKDTGSGKWKKRSTGIEDDGRKASRKKAEEFVDTLLRAQMLNPSDRITISELLKEFWDYDNSSYIRARLARNPKAISRGWASQCARNTENYIIPKLGNAYLDQLDTRMIDNFTTDLLNSGKSTQTVSHILKALRTPLDEARRKRMIPFNPMLECMPVTVRNIKKDAFTMAEASLLLDYNTAAKIYAPSEGYSGHLRRPYDPIKYWVMNVLGAVTGRRIGEILALMAEDFDFINSFVHVRRSTSRMDGVKEGTKTGAGSIIPIDPVIMGMIKHKIPDTGFVFIGYQGKPLNYKTADEALERALIAIGVSNDTQKSRKLGFHSWRHFFNTRARAGGLSDSLVQSITEHRTTAMTDHYTQYEISDKRAVMTVQRSILGLSQSNDS